MARWIQGINARGTTLLRQLLLAAQFLTVVPLPNLTNVSEEEIQGSSMFFPLVGAFLGILLWVLQLLLRMGLPNLVSTSIALILYTFLTGALHLDGLMDTADGIGSRKPREQALEIMKDSRVGAMGVVAAMMVFTGKLVVLAAVPVMAVPAIVIPPVLSRFTMVLAMKVAPSARGKEGLAGLFAQNVSFSTVGTAAVLSIAFSLFFRPIWMGAVLWIGCTAIALVATRFFTRRFGGMTGDTYGALNEIVEYVGWVLGLGLFLHK